MKRHWIISGILVCLSTSVLLAKPGIVKTHDGRTLEGDVTERADGVIVSIRGISSTIARDNIESVTYTGTIEEQYKKKLEALPATPTAKDHIDIARWLFDSKSYELARKEADAALRLDANSAEANTLYSTIQSQLRLEANKSTTGTGTTPAGPTPVVPKPATVLGEGPAHTAAMHKFLSPDEINQVRQAEWSKDDNSVKISLTPETKRKYIESAQVNASAFNALTPQEQAREILEKGTAEEKSKIRITGDPAVFAEYKRVIQPLILNNCAAAGCHGGPAGGKLFLYGSPESDAASYTNFYLIMTTRLSIGGAERMMVDREYPDKSVLVEFGLPSELTKVSHPEVKGNTWRSLFRGTEDAQYKTFMKWVGKLVPKQPSYGVNFTIDPEAAAPVAPVAPVTPAKAPVK